MVGGVHYRNPGLWVKAATTLDVLSGGRAWLGIGAAWNEDESRAPRLPVPAARRALRDARGDAPDRPRDVGGRARHARRRSTAASSRPTRLLNSPQSLSRPRVPIMIGGGGEKKTLRLVAQYADACNVFGAPEGDRPQVRDPGRALRGGRARPGRDRALDAPERPISTDRRRRPRDAGAGRRPLRRPVRCRRPARHPEHAPNSPIPAALELIGRDVIPPDSASPSPPLTPVRRIPPGSIVPCYDADMTDRPTATTPTAIEPVRGLQHLDRRRATPRRRPPAARRPIRDGRGPRSRPRSSSSAPARPA